MTDRAAEIAALADKFHFLDKLRESGATNMYGAAPFVEKKFKIDRAEAREAVSLWMKTFDRETSAASRAAAALNKAA